MLLSELFDAAQLRLRLLHAASGAYDRPIGRIITTDRLEPGNYLNGGELVLTGLVWRRSPADSETFVASVAGRGHLPQRILQQSRHLEASHLTTHLAGRPPPAPPTAFAVITYGDRFGAAIGYAIARTANP